MARVISVVNQKGGVGKTTTAVNCATYLAQEGKRVLLVDLDPQANATSAFRLPAGGELPGGVYELLAGQKRLDEVIRETRTPGLHLLPATMDLAGAHVELVTVPRREFRLRDALEGARERYDVILIDNPPSLGLLTVNGLVAADHALIPVQCEYYALEGLSQLLETVRLVRENLQPDLTILGAVLTMYDARANLSQSVFQELYQHFPNAIFRSVIPRNVMLAEAPSYGKSIADYRPQSPGARAYARLAKELLLHL